MARHGKLSSVSILSLRWVLCGIAYAVLYNVRMASRWNWHRAILSCPTPPCLTPSYLPYPSPIPLILVVLPASQSSKHQNTLPTLHLPPHPPPLPRVHTVSLLCSLSSPFHTQRSHIHIHTLTRYITHVCVCTFFSTPRRPLCTAPSHPSEDAQRRVMHSGLHAGA